ncbi:MAG TPA: ATPase, T2SS/T4P/T4SS family [Humisphaera sp.]|jgi:type II secretory ATPase GspE/PulE/Tfp pilus assembly ATPase PilB-like protein|nr:ATPase, T2SS/T4P/T4SS family [Humisphaera sp.]
MGWLHVMADIQFGGYISPWKVIPLLVVVLIWARLMTWADKDAHAAHLPRIAFNVSFLAGLILAFFLFLYLPGFLFGVIALLVIFGTEVGVYLYMRSKVVGLKDLKKQFNAWLKSFGSKKEKKAEAGKLQIFRDGKPEPVPEAESLDRPAYDTMQQALADPIFKKADQVDLVPENGALAVRYVVDGFTYSGTPIDRQLGADAIAYIKYAAKLNIDERRKPQTGSIRTNFDGTKHELKVQTAGTTAGEYARILIDPKKRFDYTIDKLGLTEAQLKTLKDSINENTGVVILSTPKSQGLTSLSYAVIKAHDVVLQFIQSVERFSEEELEGVTLNKLAPAATGAEEFKMVDWVISQEPNVMLVDKVEDPKTAAAIIEAAKGGKRIYVEMRANSAFEALDQWRRLVGDNHLAVEALKLIVNGRVLRKLCMACKVAYAPEPAALKKLNMNPEKVTQLFQARTQPIMDPKGRPVPCEFCNDLRYKGRTGVFEFLVVDDEIRQAVEAGKPLTQPFRKQRGRYLQEEAFALVEKGDTSVQEVLRILKGSPEAQGGGNAEAAAPRRPAPARK